MLEITVEASSLKDAVEEGDQRAHAFFGESAFTLSRIHAEEAGYIQTADVRQRRSTFKVDLTYDIAEVA